MIVQSLASGMLRKIVPTCKKVAGQQAVGLGAQERPPGGVQRAGLAKPQVTVHAPNSGAVQAVPCETLGDVPCRDAPTQDRGESSFEFCIGSPGNPVRGLRALDEVAKVPIGRYFREAW